VIVRPTEISACSATTFSIGGFYIQKERERERERERKREREERGGERGETKRKGERRMEKKEKREEVEIYQTPPPSLPLPLFSPTHPSPPPFPLYLFGPFLFFYSINM
jgi:hypothetical protein